MKKTLIAIALLLVATVAGAGDFLNFPNFPTRGQGPFDRGGVWWNDSSLTFYAPFDYPADPLRLIKGTGTLSFTRATTATYTAIDNGFISTAASGTLRIEAEGALIEGQRTNLSLWSSGFDNAAWTKTSGATVTADNAIAPDGTLTADFLKEGTGNIRHNVNNNVTVAAVSSSRTASVFAKAASRTQMELLMTDQITGNIEMIVDLTDGSILSGPTAGGEWTGPTGSVVDYGSGWYRISVSGVIARGNLGALLSTAVAGAAIHTGDNTSGIYLWGEQTENSAPFPSSYIPTTTATVTRNASVLTEQTTGNIDNVDGTLALQWTPKFASTDNVVTAVLFDAGGVKATYTSADRKINFTDGTNTVSSAALTFSADVAQKLAFRWGPSGLLVYRDGSESATGATYTAPMLNASLYIGTDTSSANSAYSNIKPVRTWNREFSAAEMGTITTP